MKQSLLFALLVPGVFGYANAQAPTAADNNSARTTQSLSDTEYRRVAERIFERVALLKKTYPSLSTMSEPRFSADIPWEATLGHEHHVKWVLDNSNKPASKLNAQSPIWGKDGYSFSLHFYPGQWIGAAVFKPIEFGDLKLWFQFDHGGYTPVIAAVTTILREENEAFCKLHPWQGLDQILQATRPR